MCLVRRKKHGLQKNLPSKRVFDKKHGKKMGSYTDPTTYKINRASREFSSSRIKWWDCSQLGTNQKVFVLFFFSFPYSFERNILLTNYTKHYKRKSICRANIILDLRALRSPSKKEWDCDRYIQSTTILQPNKVVDEHSL